MKKIVLIMSIVAVCYSMFGLEIVLRNDKVFKTDIIKVEGNMLLFTDGQNAVKMPIEEIGSIRDGVIGMDKQFVRNDTYFISEKGIENDKEAIVFPAKMLSQPIPENKMQAEFVLLSDNARISPKYWVKSVAADAGELKPETMVIVFINPDAKNIFRSPKSEQEANQGKWMISRIVEVSNNEDGFIVLANGAKTAFDNVRVIVK